MNATSADIAAIVAKVLETLRAQPVSSTSQAVPSVVKPEASASTMSEVVMDEAVITEALLVERIGSARRIRLAKKAVLTPTARDYLQKHRIECVRGIGQKTQADAGVSAARWQVLVSSHTPAISAAIEHQRTAGTNWETHLTGTAAEASARAASSICRGECAGVVVLTAEPELVACLANRNSAVRAVGLRSVDLLTAVLPSVRPNVLAFSPVGRNYFELRNLLQKYSQAGVPGQNVS